MTDSPAGLNFHGEDEIRGGGRHGAQGNQACLVGGVVGLAQFLNAGAPVGSWHAGAGATAAAAALPGIGAAFPTGASATTSRDLLARDSSDLEAVGHPAAIASGPAQSSGVPVAQHSATGSLSALQSVPTAAPPVSAGEQSGSSAGGFTQAAPGVSSEEAASVGDVPRASTSAEEPESPPAPTDATAALSPLVQANVSLSDHDATAGSQAITYIDTISNSIVFLGDNIAMASALNIAPVSQFNFLHAEGSWNGGMGPAKLSNAAVTDNDASAFAVAGTWINTAYNSIIIAGSSAASANATNLAPVVQTNEARFNDFGDAAFGSLHEVNFLNGDNDATAVSQAGAIFGAAALGGEPESNVPAPPHLGEATFDEVLSYAGWSDFIEA